MKPTFSPSDAALSIFEFTKRQPQFVMRYCLLWVGVTTLTFLFYAVTGVGAAFADYLATVASGKVPDFKMLEGIFTKSAVPFAILFVLSIVAGVSLMGVALRKTVRNEESGPLGLQFGKDEANLIVAGFALMFAYFGVVFVGAVLAGVGSAISPIIGVIIGVVLFLFVFYVAFRISQYGVVVIATGKTDFRAIWQRTEGQFWRFVGAYALMFIILMIISTIVQLVGNAVAGGMGANISRGMPTSLAEFATPGWLIYIFLNGAVNGFMQLSAVCVGAYAWHQMGGDATGVEEVF